MTPTHRLVAQVDVDFCMGAACCVEAAPHLFRLNADGIAEWIGGDRGVPENELRDLARRCPQSAISIVAADP